MRVLTDMAVALRHAPDGVRLVDLSCGRCSECLSGAELWCTARKDVGPDLLGPLTDEDAERALTALLAVSALAETEERGTVLVAEPAGSALAGLVQRLSDGRTVVVGDPASPDVRNTLAELDPTGRAEVVVTVGDTRRAVKAVRRGGTVCVSGASGAQPTITELVQREVTLTGPRSLARVLDALPAKEVLAALDAV